MPLLAVRGSGESDNLSNVSSAHCTPTTNILLKGLLSCGMLGGEGGAEVNRKRRRHKGAQEGKGGGLMTSRGRICVLHKMSLTLNNLKGNSGVSLDRVRS